MRKMKIIYWVVVLGLLAGCGHGKEPRIQKTDEKKISNVDAAVKNETNYDSVPFRFLPKKEQYKLAESFHSYGDYKLKMMTPIHYVYEDFDLGIRIEEYCPGVVCYSYIPYEGKLSQPYNYFKIEFYDNSKKLIDSIDLEKDNPYKKLRTEKGYPDMELFNYAEKESISLLKANGKLTKTLFSIIEVNANENGNIVIEYQLCSTKKNIIYKWEEKLVVYNEVGEKLGSISEPTDTYNSWVSQNGKYMALLFGGERSNNPQDKDFTGFKIYDLVSSELIYEQKEIESQYLLGLVEFDTDVIMLANRFKSGAERIEYFFDFNTRTKYSKHFAGEDMKQAYENFTSYADLLKKNSFTKEKF